MTKQAWQAHMAEQGFETVARPGNAEALKLALAHMRSGCSACAARRRTRNASRAARIRKQTLRDLGLAPVRGGNGWE